MNLYEHENVYGQNVSVYIKVQEKNILNNYNDNQTQQFETL